MATVAGAAVLLFLLTWWQWQRGWRELELEAQGRSMESKIPRMTLPPAVMEPLLIHRVDPRASRGVEKGGRGADASGDWTRRVRNRPATDQWPKCDAARGDGFSPLLALSTLSRGRGSGRSRNHCGGGIPRAARRCPLGNYLEVTLSLRKACSRIALPIPKLATAPNAIV